MLQNIFKIAFRNLLKDKFYSFLNIIGLSIGIAASFLILLYIADELSFDKFHEDADRIYRISAKGKFGDREIVTMAVSCAPLAESMLKHIPEVETVTRIASEVIIFNHNEEIYKEVNVFYADSTFFDVFSFKLYEGDKKTVLKDPYSLVLTEESAIRFFGQEALSDGSVLGQLIKSGDNTYKVTGIIENIPHNSHFDFDMLVSMSTNEDALSPIWLNMRYYTYAKLHKGIESDELERGLRHLVLQYLMPQVVQYMNFPEKNYTEDNIDETFKFFLQPVTDIHLKSNIRSELKPNGNIQYIYVFTIISIFIILIACINFMNLATARSSHRAREVGMRKTLGARRFQLIRQFLGESIITAIFSLALAVLMLNIVRPAFMSLWINKYLNFNLNIIITTTLSVLFIGFRAIRFQLQKHKG